MRRIAPFTLLAIIGWFGASASAQTATTQPTTAAATQPATWPTTLTDVQISQLIASLSADDWQARQQSADALVAGGRAVVARVAAATQATTDVDVRTTLQTVLQRIDEAVRTQATRITLHAHDAPAVDVLSQLAKQVDFPISVDSPDFLSSAKVTIDADNTPFWAVLAAVLPQTPARVALGTSDLTRLSLQPMGQAMFGPKSVVCGPAIVCPMSMQSSRQLDLVAPGAPTRMRVCAMQMFVLVEPKLNAMQITLDTPTAVDEHGKTIGVAGSPVLRGAGGMNMINSAGVGTSLFMRFQPPADAGNMIASLKATLRIRVPVQGQATETPLKMNQPVPVRVAYQAAKATLIQQGDQYQLTIEPDDKTAVQQSFRDAAAQIQLADANGVTFVRRMVNADQASLRLFFAVHSVGLGKPAAGEPAKMIWSHADQSRELTEPFELKDIPLMQ